MEIRHGGSAKAGTDSSYNLLDGGRKMSNGRVVGVRIERKPEVYDAITQYEELVNYLEKQRHKIFRKKDAGDNLYVVVYKANGQQETKFFPKKASALKFAIKHPLAVCGNRYYEGEEEYFF